MIISSVPIVIAAVVFDDAWSSPVGFVPLINSSKFDFPSWSISPSAPFSISPSNKFVVDKLSIPLSSGFNPYTTSHPSGNESPSVSFFKGSVSNHCSLFEYNRFPSISPSIVPSKFLSSPNPSLNPSLSVSGLFGSVSIHESLKSKISSGHNRSRDGGSFGLSDSPSPSTHPFLFKSSIPSEIPSKSLSGLFGSVVDPALSSLLSPSLKVDIAGTRLKLS